MADKIKICLDAGHYGKYNRSPVVKEYYESDMVWKLHLLLKKALEAYGFEVITTRASKDKDLPVTARGKAAKGCDLFLSLHSNAANSESVDYPVVYVPLNGSGDAIGEELAKCIETVMGTRQKGRINTRKGNHGDYYGVIRGAVAVGVPGLILEHSFHTNTKATRWLLDDANLAELAKAEAEVLAEHYGLEKPAQDAQETIKWYRVRKSWDDAKSQLGAFLRLEHAKTACAAGFTVYDWTGKAVYSKPGKSVDQLAREVLAGKWGNGSERKRRLTTAGYDYKAVQARVNELA